MPEKEFTSKTILRLSLILWGCASLLRFWNISLYAGLTFDDSAYAMCGKSMVLTGRDYWGDTLRPFASWWVAFFHMKNGISIINVGIAFATLRSLGEYFLIQAVRRLFPDLKWAPLMAAFISASSFLGVLYGKQHLSSLLFTIPLSLWLYARFLNSNQWKDWSICAFSTGLVFLSHYNTIAALVFMLGLEILRQFLIGQKISRIIGMGVGGAGLCFLSVMSFGKLSYGFANWLTFIRQVWQQIASNQTRTTPAFSDGYLGAMTSWEGIAMGLYVLSMGWMIFQSQKDSKERRFLALGWLPLLGAGLVWLRVNLGYLSFPRLYVFAIPFVWIASAGFLGTWISRSLEHLSARTQKMTAIGIIGFALAMQASHQHFFQRFASGNAGIEHYLKNHPTQKMALWDGNPHIGAFFFDWHWSPCFLTREEVMENRINFWSGIPAPRFNIQTPDEKDPRRQIYLQCPDLTNRCDLILLQMPTREKMNQVNQYVLKVAPHAFTTNLYHGALTSLRLMSDELGILSLSHETMETRLPMVRLYDLRGSPDPH